jgi:DNA-binding response OmpR family regulator
VLTVGDESQSRRELEALVQAAGWTSVTAYTLHDACATLAAGEGPRVALVDWRTPELRSISLLRRVRALPAAVQPYVILVTATPDAEAVLSGLTAGADDYLPIPGGPSGLQARLRVALRSLLVQDRLNAQARELAAAAARVQQLQSLISICAYCRRIRAGEQRWEHVAEFLSDHTDVRFSHGYCPDCYAEHVQPHLKAS